MGISGSTLLGLFGSEAAAGTAAAVGGDVLAGEVLTTAAAPALFTAADAAGLGAAGLGAAGTAGAFGGSAAAAPAAGGSTTILSSMVQPTAFTSGGTGTTLPGTQGPPATSSLSTPNGTAFGSPTSGGASASSAPTIPGISGNPDLSTSLLTPDQGVAQAGIPSIGPSGGSIGTINPAPTLPGLDAAPANSIGAAIDHPTLGTIGHALGENAAPLAAGVGLARDLLAPQTLPQSGQLTAQANQLTNQGTQLQSYLTSGTLPPGVKTAIDSATKSAQAAIRSKYAANGMSGSTAETQELAQAELSSANQGTQIALQLLNTGIDEVGLSSKIYEQLMSANTAQNNATGSAIANLASALGGGTKIPVGNSSVTING